MTSIPDSSSAWFKRCSLVHWSVSGPGVVATLLTLVLSVDTFLAVGGHSRPMSDTLGGLDPVFVATFLFWTCLAEGSSGK